MRRPGDRIGRLRAVCAAALLLAGGASARAAAAGDDGAVWRGDLTAGFDSSLYTYALATTDTTETLTEWLGRVGVSGRSAFTGRRRWRLRAEAGAGTESFRQRFEGDLGILDGGGAERLRLAGRFWGRQYRDDATTASSDNLEGRLDAVATPWRGAVLRTEVRGWAGAVGFAMPSSLQMDRRDAGLGVALRSLPLADVQWGVGARTGWTAYPDSAVIDRRTWSLEADLDSQTLDRSGWRLYHKSERRLVRDEGVRPSAWTHWLDAAGALPAGRGHVVVEARLEAWRYDAETDVYYDSTRLEGLAGYRWGDPLGTVWQLGVVAERFGAGEQPETYRQVGLRGGVESWAGNVSGTLTLEYGRRLYDDGAMDLTSEPTDLLTGESDDLYTDFGYWRLWLLATWRLSDVLDLDALGNYAPESHAEKSDDTTLGFASVRLRWRY